MATVHKSRGEGRCWNARRDSVHRLGRAPVANISGLLAKFPRGATLAGKRARVLFVDDEPHVLSTIRRSLAEDFDVHTAESGHAALALLEENEPFSVIVADCRMPKMNGIELLSRASREHPDAVRIMLTGNTDQQTAVQ